MKKIELDRDTCIASATCIGFAPTAFKLTGDGRAELLVEDAAGIDAGALDNAVANCPTGSIRLIGTE
ncbi:ferredoxin [Actinomadura sp. WMMB 499]|uniref:ferredoxin n=1 Tax=Actinomadura sp. WMMB 499 TaxID=1219491 RepID=UPI0012464DD3|nr:ferredoxin [Actinomadura sp. WMMB 499]QFG21314.1 ferredoxin [Actinomadura sp. WMMB 499]